MGRGPWQGVGVMSPAALQDLPISEKLRMMEALWEDLRSHVDQAQVPDWHKDLLDARRRAVSEGREQILDWDKAKKSPDAGGG